MKSVRFIVVLLLIVLSNGACSSPSTRNTSHLRFITMIPNLRGVIKIKSTGQTPAAERTIPIGPYRETDYRSLHPGHYKIRLQVHNKALLERTYVIGKRGYYTLAITGLLPSHWSTNPETTLYKLKHIFAGSELHDSNRYLPQWFLMRDNYDGNLKDSYIRIINAAPHSPTLTVKDGDTSIKSGLSYPKETEMTKLKAGRHTLRIMYGKVEIGSKTFEAKAGYVYSVFLGDPMDSRDNLAINIIQDPSRSLLYQRRRQ